VNLCVFAGLGVFARNKRFACLVSRKDAKTRKDAKGITAEPTLLVSS